MTSNGGGDVQKSQHLIDVLRSIDGEGQEKLYEFSKSPILFYNISLPKFPPFLTFRTYNNEPFRNVLK